jgi:hypothetical protein
VLIVVAWSIVGVGIGVVIGLVFAAVGIPPGGAFGVLVQAIAWGLFFHIMVGLWAGYALLTTGESRRPVARTRDGRVVVGIRAVGTDAEALRGRLRSTGATSVTVYGADGHPIS